MAGNDQGRAIQGVKLTLDALFHLLEIAAPKIRPPHTAAKKGVPREDNLPFFKIAVEAARAWRVARRVQRRQARESIARIEFVHFRLRNFLESKAIGLHVQMLDEEVIALMQIGRALPEILQFLGRAHMIEMGVGVQQSRHPEARSLNVSTDLRAIAAGIHHDASTLFRVPHQAAIAPKPAYGKSIELQHGFRIMRIRGKSVDAKGRNGAFRPLTAQKQPLGAIA